MALLLAKNSENGFFLQKYKNLSIAQTLNKIMNILFQDQLWLQDPIQLSVNPFPIRIRLNWKVPTAGWEGRARQVYCGR